MTVEKLRQAVLARPFRPFTIVAGDGTRYRVSHPEMVGMAPGPFRTFVVFTGRGEDHVLLDLFLVTALEFANGHRSNGRANGRRRRDA